MLHNAGSIEAINIDACHKRSTGKLRSSVYHSKIPINKYTQDVGYNNLKERLLKVGDGGISAVQDKGIVLDVSVRYMIGQCLSILSGDVELLNKVGEDAALGC